MHTSALAKDGSRLHEMCMERAINNQIMLTFANFGYLDMLLNWLYNIEVKLRMSNFIIVALDKPTYDALNSMSIGVLTMVLTLTLRVIFLRQRHNEEVLRH